MVPINGKGDKPPINLGEEKTNKKAFSTIKENKTHFM